MDTLYMHTPFSYSVMYIDGGGGGGGGKGGRLLAVHMCLLVS